MISDVTLKIGMNWICREKKVINGTTMKFIFFTDGLNKKIFPKLLFILCSYCSGSLSFVHYSVKPEQNHAYHKFTGQTYI